MGNENKYLNAALHYSADFGWAVFPVDNKSKKPLTPHGCKDAKKETGAIKAWWKRYPNASIGVATGPISGLVVIDLDRDPDKGLDGYEELCRWESENGNLPDTVMATTGRGGIHLYYRYAGDDIKNRAGILQGVDVRGEGGYVIAPPSLHPNGTEYVWDAGGDPDDMEPVLLDDQVRKFLSIGKAKEPGTAAKFEVPDVIERGQRNDVLFRLACSMQSQGFPDDAIRAALKSTNEAKCATPLEDEEVDQIANSALTYHKGELKVIGESAAWHEPAIEYKLDKDGNQTDQPLQTIENAKEAITYDSELFGRIKYNELAYAPWVYGNTPWKVWRGWREWTNADEANLLCHIEKKYGLKNHEKIRLGFSVAVSRNRFNPVKQMLEDAHEQWDGNKHVENLLPMMLGAEKNEYTISVMKMFMLGAVHRIFQPGCKFDYMLVLVGGQGIGKSSFLRFLAMNDAFFSDNFNSLEGDTAFEKLRGMWIVEMAELQATKRAKDVETIKSFITSREDIYRTPYERITEKRPRMCVLVGTSNPVDFLTDQTGNRRFLPVDCGKHEAPFDMFEDEISTRAEFQQAWGEIMDEYMRCGGRPRLVLSKRVQKMALAAQLAYQEDDPWVGIIQQWLDDTSEERVCVAMLWREALGNTYAEPRKQDINHIHEIMKNNVAGWKAIGKQRCGSYGTQRSYEREKSFEPAAEIPF